MMTPRLQGKNEVDNNHFTRPELLDDDCMAARVTCFWMFPKVTKEMLLLVFKVLMFVVQYATSRLHIQMLY